MCVCESSYIKSPCYKMYRDVGCCFAGLHNEQCRHFINLNCFILILMASMPSAQWVWYGVYKTPHSGRSPVTRPKETKKKYMYMFAGIAKGFMIKNPLLRLR